MSFPLRDGLLTPVGRFAETAGTVRSRPGIDQKAPTAQMELQVALTYSKHPLDRVEHGTPRTGVLGHLSLLPSTPPPTNRPLA